MIRDEFIAVMLTCFAFAVGVVALRLWFQH